MYRKGRGVLKEAELIILTLTWFSILYWIKYKFAIDSENA